MTLDEQELLSEFYDSQYWPVLQLALRALVKEQENNVLRYRLDEGPEKLLFEKARAEGASNLVNKLELKRKQVVRVNRK